ncbi:hypothetical protein ES319_D02G206000v1 [Gossypium barbadense]|uniref:Uncharacterized protein n=1 Tax=Gossypium barbadense TaxID=3634 RepID=A0A5J5SFL0_GOSBA|nr:hypothetical protein ES319_D02G206000v1 [Gossypium barbadense]
METDAKRKETSLSSILPAQEAQKVAKRVTDCRYTALINLVQKLPDELHHDTMVPFVKSAVFPGRLVHTNEFLVLLGESYYVERTLNKLESLVELREEDEEENTTEPVSQLGRGCPTFAEENKLMGAPEDDEYARIMSRLEELEKELAAKSYGENEKWDTNAAESDGPRKPLLQSKGKDPMSEEISNKYQLASTGFTVGPVIKGEMSHSQCMPQATEIRMLYPSINASVPSEKVKSEAEHSSRDEVFELCSILMASSLQALLPQDSFCLSTCILLS